MLKHIKTNEEFKESYQKGLVLIDFFATWCGPCRMLGPVLEDVANTKQDITILKVDVDQLPDIAQAYRVQVIPTLYLVKDGHVIAHESGFMPKQKLLNFISQAE